MATSEPARPPLGPGQVPGEGGGGVGEVVGEPLKGQLSGGGPAASGGEQSGPSQIMKTQLPGDPALHGGPPVQVGPQVSVAGHVQHVSVAGQVQQAGPGGEVIVSGGNGGVPPGGDGDDLPQKRKATSFKITNVFLSRPPSNDGDDSCDDNEDLEDSHTEDLSDIADSLNSLSSQLESVAALNNPVNGVVGQQAGQQQVIQTGPGGKTSRGQPQQSSKEGGGSVSRKPSNVSEYRRPSLAADKLWESSLPPYTHPGFGFVTYQHTGGATYPVSYVDKATGYLPVAGTMAVINNVEKGGVSEVPVSSQAVAGPQDFRTRFKIVKVETTIPLKRGRWTCFDFVDKPAAKDPKEKELQPEVNKTVTATTTKPVTVAKNSEKGASRPNSTLPKDELTSDTGLPVRPDSVEQAGQGEGEKGVRVDRVAGQTETAPVASIVSGSVSEERELDTGKSVTVGHTSRLTNSVPPDGLRNVSYPNASYPTPPVTVASSSVQSTTVQANSLNITLPQPVMTSGVAVQSPHTGVRPDFPQVQSIQGSLGQVVRLPDGQLAQVALAPLQQPSTQQQQGQQQQQQQQQQVVLQRIPNSNNHSLAPQQQVVVNAQGQHFIVQQQQQQTPQNINQVPQQQPGRSQAAPQQQQNSQQPPQQQQPAKKISQQPQQVSTAGVTQTQQIPFPSGGQAVAPPNLPTAQPMQPQPPGPSVPLQQGPAGAPPPQNAQSQVSQPPPTVAPVSQPQPPVNPTVQTQQPAPQQNQNPGVAVPGSAQVPTIKRAGLPTTTNPVPPPASSGVTGQPSQQQQQQPQPARNSTVTQPAVAAVSSVAPASLSVSQPTQNINQAQPVPSVAQPGQSLQSVAHIGQSVANIAQPSQNLAQPTQSLPQNGQNSTKTVPSVAQQALVAPSLPQSSAAQSALPGMAYASLPSTSLSSVQGQTTTAATTHSNFYPIPYSHPVYSGVSVVGQVDNSYGLVAASVGLDGEGLVERLEDLVSTQLSEEGKEGELENESASGAGQGSIDNRIEQAMDLVKSHLMSAVRSEVEELRDKISKLEDTVTILSRENEVLRANVNPEVLASLTGNRNLVGGMNSISNLPCQPPDPSGHPALQPPNQH